MSRHGWLVFALAPLLGGCGTPDNGASPGHPDESTTPVQQVTQRFQQRLDELHLELEFIGATAAFILPDGNVGAAAVGFADFEKQIEMTPEHRMPAASIGKTMAAATALSMVAEGLLGLDDLASKWLGQETWFPRLANHQTITLRHLLTHSSGLTDHVFSEAYRQAARARRQGPNSDPDAWFTPPELVGFQQVLPIGR